MLKRKATSIPLRVDTPKRIRVDQGEVSQSRNETTLSSEDYTVGWICALPVELAAARVMRDEEYGQITVADGDTNSYVLGRVGLHNVVMACLPQGTVGTNSAAIVATNMTRTFPQLRFILLVGVGAGAPDPGNTDAESDIRLGDVVVSKPDIRTGGVIQYDFGKVLQSSGFSGGKSLNKPPPILRTAVARLEALHLTEDSQIEDILEATYQSYPRVRKKFQSPGHTQDYLFEASYEHVDGRSDCRSCQWEQVVIRPPRDDSLPRIHYGLIASANRVMRDALVREEMRRYLGVICFEMEAAGMMDDCPCLVVRGICDYADSHKSKQWQPYAALTAAAYAKELLQSMEASSVTSESAVQLVDVFRDQVEATREQADLIRKYHKKQDARSQEEKNHACHRVFHTSEYQRYKDDTNPDGVPGTGRWVLDDAQYRRWSTSTHDDLLWISADPGCGKSVLSKSLVDVHLARSDETRPHTICYFFFKDNEQQNSLSTALCAILHQLFSQQPGLIRHALPSFNVSGDQLRHDTYELWRIIQNAASDVGAFSITCVLDALDECRETDRKQLIDLLCRSYNGSRAKPSTNSPLKWLVTSRSYDDIRDRFEMISSDLPSIRLHGEDKSNQIMDEINLVIHARVADLSRELRLSTAKADELLQQLLSMEHRTYLWLYLAVEAIRDTFRDAIRPSDQVLVRVPVSVEEAYERILARINSKQRKQAETVLTIIVGARRPLNLEEMALALDTATLPQAPTASTDLTIDAKQLGDRIRRWCGLFVLVVDNRLYLLHETAKEFLLGHDDTPPSGGICWKYCLPLFEVEKRLATVCVRFLCLADFNSPRQSESSGQDEKTQILQTFFEFAAQNWAGYVQSIEERLDEETRNGMEVLYDTSSERWTRWTSAMWEPIKSIYGQFDMNRVQLAAFNGHNLLLRKEISTSREVIDSENFEGRTSLIWASLRGYTEAVKTLLGAGADVNKRSRYYGTPLEHASDSGHATVVQMLLDAGADVNAGGKGGTLHAASFEGHEKVVQMLLDAGADVNAGGEETNALFAASSQGHEGVVQMLLEAGTDVTAENKLSKALWAAAVGGHEQVVRILLQVGADVSAESTICDDALSGAASNGHETVVRMLLDAGADCNAGRRTKNALCAASSCGDENVVQMLLDAGADVDAGEETVQSGPLRAASLQGHEKVVRMLLEAGTNVNAQDDVLGQCALVMASSQGHEKVVQILLEAGADVNPQDPSVGECALVEASRHGHEEVVQILLKAGADVNTRNKRRGSALHAASFADKASMVEMLLKAGADVNLKDDFDRGALHEASAMGNTKVVQLLLDAGADVNEGGEDNSGPLAAAITHKRDDVIQILTDAGAKLDFEGASINEFVATSACKSCRCYDCIEQHDYWNNVHFYPWNPPS